MAAGTIVDVRTPEEFEGGHVPGSINIPLDQVPARTSEFRTMATPIVLCCRSGARSGQALLYLEARGITGLQNGGGWTDVAMTLDPQ